MAKVIKAKKAYSQNPLKSSAPLGAALAYLGIEQSLPLFHGSQGCSVFGMLLALRHFGEELTVHSTGMNELTSVLGGRESLQDAILTLAKTAQPKLIGVASTALVETSGEDWIDEIRQLEVQRARELGETVVVSASTPDFDGALEEGWAAAVSALLERLVDGPLPRQAGRINVLPGVHQTSAELDELRTYVSHFGLSARIVPEVAAAGGHTPARNGLHAFSGAKLSDVAQLGAAEHTLALGEHMAGAAEWLARRTGVPYTVLHAWTGLEGTDQLVQLLGQLSGVAAPEVLRRERTRLCDAYLDAGFWFSGKRVAIAGDPDLLYPLSEVFATLGAQLVTAVASTGRASVLRRVRAQELLVSDLGDFEEHARAAQAELLVTHSHGRMAAERLGVPLYRVGFPIFDRLGVQDRCWVGYSGTRRLVHELANVFAAAGTPGPAPCSTHDMGYATKRL
ncbi:MAG: nitrogenase iron-molybdenum cofactor biosynthesis protein NifN [Polyangiales bacterium]